MKLRSTTEWKPRDAKKRTIRLYKAWRNLNGRTQGHNVNSQGNAMWEDIGNKFTSWQHFREWSLAHGFSKRNNSCDRIRSSEGYGPNNCRWISVADNSRHACATLQYHRSIIAFQLSPLSDEEQAEQEEFNRLCLRVYHCPASDMNRVIPPASLTASPHLR